MSTSFVHTYRALARDRASSWRGTTVLLSIAVAWCAWLGLARVSLHRTSVSARVEVVAGVSRVAAPIDGRVVTVDVTVGARVAAGDVLVSLDTSVETIALVGARARLTAAETELASLEIERAAEERSSLAGESVGRADVSEQDARRRALDAELAYLAREQARIEALGELGTVAMADVDKTRAAVTTRRAERDALRFGTSVRAASAAERTALREARLAALDRQRSEVAAEIASVRAEADRLSLAIERAQIRAPIAGTLGASSPLRPGSVVTTGTPIATIVPDGTIHVVAGFAPVALGRIAPGQRADLKIDGFPWPQFGAVRVRVTRVGSEIVDGTVRVELAIEPGGHRIPLTHGMVGQVEVEVERATPAALIVRTLVSR